MFIKVYNVIPTQFKPPPGAAQLQCVEAFDSDFSLWLSKIRSVSLADMMYDVIEVEINLTATREKGRK